MAATDQLVKNVLNTTYDALPADVLEPTKVQILDTLGVAVAGTSFGTADPLINLVKEWGGKEEATILVYGDRVPAPHAAMVNGFMAAVLDYDDTDDRCSAHISANIVMPGFAIAERLGGVSGKDFMAAVALGFDLAARLGRAELPKKGRELTSAWAGGKSLAAASVSGKLLNLDEVKLRNALGIAMEEVSDGMIGYGDGATSKGAWGWTFSRAGIIAALLAEGGMTGASDPIEGPRGYYKAFQKKYIPEVLTVDLGKVYAGTTDSIKLYPCCRLMGNALDATLALLQGHEIKLEDVAEVVVEGGPRILRMFQQYLPSEKIAVIEDAHHFAAVVHQGQVRTQDRKYHPQNPIQCQFSMPWSVASAIVHGKVGIDDFTWQALQDKRVLDFAQRVTYKLNPELARAMVVEPVVVEIKMKSGEVYTKRVEASLGSPENPASWDIIINKFRDCCAHAVKPIPRENVDRVVRMAETLEDVTDVTEIVHLLA